MNSGLDQHVLVVEDDPGRLGVRLRSRRRSSGSWRAWRLTRDGWVLDVHVVALRRKLGDPARVETVYGSGFRLGDAR